MGWNESLQRKMKNLAGIYLLKVYNSRSGVFIVNFEHISYFVLLVLFLNLSR